MIITKNRRSKKNALLNILILVVSIGSAPLSTSEHEYAKNDEEILWYYDLDAPSFGSAATDDIDGDGLLEIVFGTYFNDEHVYALNAEDGSLLWKYDTGGCNDASPVIADVDLDGELEVIIPASSPYKVYCFNGANGTVEWSRSTGYPNCIDSPPAIADLDNDEKPEIVFGTFYGYVFCLNGENGSICWQINLGSDSYIQSCPNILDVDNNGQLDIVVAQYSGDCEVFALYGNNGSTIWHSAIPQDYMYHGGSFADIDEDGLPEIIIGSYDGYVYVFNGEDGSLQWSYHAPYYIGAPTSIADLNNDNHLEIVFASHNYLGVLSHLGNLSWSYTAGGSIFRGASICDTNGDGLLDVVFGSEDGYLRVLRGDNGSIIWSLDLEAHYGNTFQIDHAPILDDFDQDGTIDVFIIGGYGISDPSDGNHGRAYAIQAGNGTGPGWPMFRHDRHHSACFEYQFDEFNVYVDDNAESNWYDATHVRTIQEGINNASINDTVFVYNGTYYENVIVNKTVELIGEDQESTFIDGGMTADVVIVTVDWVTMSGFTMQNSGEMCCGLYLSYSNNNHISSNIILNNWYGIILGGSPNNTVTGNNVSNNIYGIGLSASSDNTIYNNFFSNTNNFFDDGTNSWNISKTPGTNIIGGPYLGGNYWSDYMGADTDGDGLGDTNVPYGPGDYLPLALFLDVNQSTFNRGFPIRHALDGDWAAAQSFSPTFDYIASAEIYMRKFGSPEFNLTVELREGHPQGTLVDTLIFTPPEVPSSWTWFLLDFTDTPIISGIQYFIVCPPAPSGVTTSFGYEWGYAFGNQYDDGAFWFTRNGGGLWRDLPTMYEFTFQTYGHL